MGSVAGGGMVAVGVLSVVGVVKVAGGNVAVPAGEPIATISSTRSVAKTEPVVAAGTGWSG